MVETALTDISEAEATGSISEIYTDLRHALRVPMVNLIFRHMATVPGCLEWVWGTIGPLYASGQIVAAAEALMVNRLPLQMGLTTKSITAFGLDDAGREGVSATCEAYGRANPANLLALKTLQMIMSEAPAARARRKPLRGLPPRPAPATATALPPMASLTTLPEDLKKTLMALSAQLHGADGRVVTSFYRHFTAWPALLDGLRTHLQPLIDDEKMNEAAAVMDRDAHGAARMLYLDCPVSRLTPPSEAALTTLRELIELFPPTLCKMTLIARALGAAISKN